MHLINVSGQIHAQPGSKIHYVIVAVMLTNISKFFLKAL